MANYVYVLCIAGGLAVGTLVAYLNSRLTRKSIGKDSMAAIMGTNAARFGIDIAALGLAYLLCEHFGWPTVATLVSLAVGLSVCGLLFIGQITKELKAPSGAETENGGDDGCRNS